jgi:hypothetical protein
MPSPFYNVKDFTCYTCSEQIDQSIKSGIKAYADQAGAFIDSTQIAVWVRVVNAESTEEVAGATPEVHLSFRPGSHSIR